MQEKLQTNTTVSDQKHIIDQVETYIRRGGGEYEDWFIGLADNPIAPSKEVSRLHKAKNRTFAYVETLSGEVAKAVAEHFINVCGTDGDISEAEKDGARRALYFYKKAEHLVAPETGISDRLICWVRNKAVAGSSPRQ